MSPEAAKVRTRPASGKEYGYANARLRGMRSRLFNRAFFDNLIAAPDIKTLIQDLTATEYGPDLEDALIHGRDAATIEAALKNHMIRTYQKVFSFLNDEGLYLVQTLLGRWDIFNIKTILRGKHIDAATDEIVEGLLPAGQLTAVELEALAGGEDIKTVIDTAVTWGLPFAGALREGYAEYLETESLADLELALDRYYSTWATQRLKKRQANSRLALSIVRMQVDTLNLLTVLRAAKESLETEVADRYFLEGGRDFSKSLYEELAAMSDIDEILDKLRETPYGKILDAVAIEYLSQNSISVFERSLEDYLMRHALGLAKGDPLGVGVAIAYLWAKQNEMTNLRIIVRGKAVGMPVERVRGELILV